MPCPPRPPQSTVKQGPAARGLKAVMLAAQAIRAGDAQLIVGWRKWSRCRNATPLPARSTRRSEARRPAAARWPREGRPVVLVRQLPHGWPRGVHGTRGRRGTFGGGRLRARISPAGATRDRHGEVRCRGRAGGGARPKGLHDSRCRRVAPAVPRLPKRWPGSNPPLAQTRPRGSRSWW